MASDTALFTTSRLSHPTPFCTPFFLYPILYPIKPSYPILPPWTPKVLPMSLDQFSPWIPQRRPLRRRPAWLLNPCGSPGRGTCSGSSFRCAGRRWRRRYRLHERQRESFNVREKEHKKQKKNTLQDSLNNPEAADCANVAMATLRKAATTVRRTTVFSRV